VLFVWFEALLFPEHFDSMRVHRFEEPSSICLASYEIVGSRAVMDHFSGQSWDPAFCSTSWMLRVGVLDGSFTIGALSIPGWLLWC
jgi:hypothetical protein